MKVLSLLLVVVVMMGFAGFAYAESNDLALGMEKLTHAPFAGLMDVNDHLFTPVKEVNHGALDVTDKARGWIISVGLNLGQPVE